ncbi:hypothetical protein Ac2012v2_004604 [Leucoagaricus gongylophorus]
MHRDARTYYEDPSAGGQYSTGQYSSPGGTYPMQGAYNHATYDYQENAQYYPPHAHPNDGSHPTYCRSMTPALHPQRYSNSGSNREYYSQSALITSSSPLPQSYNAQGYYSDQYPNSSLGTRSPANQTSFIPTPSEMASSYSDYSQTLPSHSPTAGPYGPGANAYSNSASIHSQRPRTRISTGRPRTASGATASPTSATSPSGERFPCENCGKTFSRSHDRKRHHETQHLPSPVIHRCQFCEKEFSRADSLKRHLDNGCDEMPQ